MFRVKNDPHFGLGPEMKTSLRIFRALTPLTFRSQRELSPGRAVCQDIRHSRLLVAILAAGASRLLLRASFLSPLPHNFVALYVPLLSHNEMWRMTER